MKKFFLLIFSVFILSCTSESVNTGKNANNISSNIDMSHDWQVTVTKYHTVDYKDHANEVLDEEDGVWDEPHTYRWYVDKQKLTYASTSVKEIEFPNTISRIGYKFIVPSSDQNNNGAYAVIDTLDFSGVKNHKLVTTHTTSASDAYFSTSQD